MLISLTNITGARNRGVDALVSSSIAGLTKVLNGVNFAVHTNDFLFDSWRYIDTAKVIWSYLTATGDHSHSPLLNKSLYKVAQIAEKPLSKNKRIRLDTITTIKKSDLIIPSGGDIFTSDYGNLRKHLAYVAISDRRKVYLMGHTIGPFNKKDKDDFLRSVDGIAAISAREEETFQYLKSLDVQTDVHLTADVAFTLSTLSEYDTAQFAYRRYGFDGQQPTVALSISQGIIRYSNLNAGEYYKLFAEICDYFLQQGKAIMLIPHVMERNPNNNDVLACDEVLKRISVSGRVYVASGEPSAVELKSIIGLCEGLIGTRTHATIASMSQLVPTVSLAYSRKAYGIMTDVYGAASAGAVTIDVKEMSASKVIDAYECTLSAPIDAGRMQAIKDRAKLNFTLASKLIEGR